MQEAQATAWASFLSAECWVKEALRL
jgi:hypothetical protein